MIDIHSHILPGVDDGAKNEQASIDMAKAAIEDGITDIVASPHHKNNSFDNYRDEIRTYVTVLNDLFRSEGLSLNVIPGQEVRIYGDMLIDLEKGDLQTVNDSKYLLVEFPSDSVPHYASQLFYELQMDGIQPVIVHPERNRELLNNHEKMYELVQNGALTQVTAGSIVGNFGKDIQTFSQQLIETNLTHFVATDAHNTSSRGFNLQAAYDYIQNNINVETAYTFMENSHLLVDDMNVYRQEPQRIKTKKRFFGLF